MNNIKFPGVERIYDDSEFVVFKFVQSEKAWQLNVPFAGGSTLDQLNFCVFRKGITQIYDSEGTWIADRSPGETSDTATLTIGQGGKAYVKSTDSGAEFFCITKKTGEKVKRVQHRTSAKKAAIPIDNGLLLVVEGTATLDSGEKITASNVVKITTPHTITLGANAWVILLS